jgi:hypothetical protein
VVRKGGQDDDRTKALSFRALELVAVGPLLAMGLICLLTGVLLGLGSKYGVLRYWWAAVELALNLVLTGLVLVSLAPEVADAAERARQFDAGVPVPLGVGDLIFAPLVSPTALLLAMVLAVFKPWGPSAVDDDQSWLGAGDGDVVLLGRRYATGRDPEDMDWAVTHQAASAISS